MGMSTAGVMTASTLMSSIMRFVSPPASGGVVSCIVAIDSATPGPTSRRGSGRGDDRH
jgi:hypothetical protein